ncbi:MAG TPA: hypothetical protein VF166_11070 [Gemmatimonadaceae bacterium]
MPHSRLRGMVLVAWVMALTACADLSGSRGPKISVSLDLQHAFDVQPVLHVDIDGQRVQLITPDTGAPRASIDIRGARYGALPVRVTLATVLGDTLASVGFSQQFERNTDHWVGADVGTRRPLGMCIGDLLAVPLAAPGGDTLFVMYGGIPEGAIC